MLNELNDSLYQVIDQTKANWPVLACVVLLPWLVYLLNGLLGRRLFFLGIIPRRWYGLSGIVFAPLLHANFNHLFFNSIPLLVLSNFILVNGLPYFLWATLFITVVSGSLIWLFGKPGLHIGASALITGYWGLLVCGFVQQDSLTSIILGVVSLYYFIGIFFGVFPGRKGVSWEGHLFGLLAGIAFSFLTQVLV
ncbi:rhomboid family intramembrane serine protease [Legionella sp. CNM-4043-24]|uniref:rhomboid family intramembrane serine protease n=1 Tax=Legionella sp. CNM-4043-24 TaxID=3421646 RepID=UPI00403B333B